MSALLLLTPVSEVSGRLLQRSCIRGDAEDQDAGMCLEPVSPRIFMLQLTLYESLSQGTALQFHVLPREGLLIARP